MSDSLLTSLAEGAGAIKVGGEVPEAIEAGVEGLGTGTEGSVESLANEVLEAADSEERFSLTLCEGYAGDLGPEGRLLLGDGSASSFAGELAGINAAMEGEAQGFRQEVKDIMAGDVKEPVGDAVGTGWGGAVRDGAEPGSGDMGESQKHCPVEGEVVYDGEEWLADDIDEQTKEWLLGEGMPEATDRFTPEEKETAREFVDEMYARARSMDSNATAKGQPPKSVGVLNEVSKDNDEQEAIQLLLRIAIKASVKVAVASAKELMKDPNTPKSMRVALSIFVDVAEEGGKLAEKLITGEDKPDLGRDCVKYISGRLAPKAPALESE